jgi:hypothetical protein
MRTENRLLVVASLAFATATLSLAGCQANPQAPSITLKQEIRDPSAFDIDVPAGSEVDVNGAPLELYGGSLRLSAPGGDTLSMDGLALAFGDYVVNDGTLLDGTHLTDVFVKLAEPADADADWTWTGDAAFATVEVDLELSWSLVTKDGKVVPLAPQTLHAVPLALSVWRDDSGHLSAEITGGVDGKFWSLSDLASMSDLRVDLRATR